jgi:spore germination protein YaaH
MIKKSSIGILSIMIIFLMITPVAWASDNSSSSKVIYAYWPYWIDSQSYQPDWSILTYVSYFSIRVNSDGTLDTNNIGKNYYSVRDTAHAHNVKITLTIESFDQDVQDNILVNKQRELAMAILQNIKYYGTDGISIDFEELRTINSITNEPNSILMRDFMRTLYGIIKGTNSDYHISYAVNHRVDNEFQNDNLSQFVDALFLMGYDYHWSNSNSTGAVSPFQDNTQQDIEDSVKILEAYYPKNKIILGLPFYGYEWPSSSGKPMARVIGEGKDIDLKNSTYLSKIYGRIWDPSSNTPWFKYQKDGIWYQTWYDDDESLGLKIDYVYSENLKGVGIWALGYEGNNATIWNTIKKKSESRSKIKAVPGFEGVIFMMGFFIAVYTIKRQKPDKWKNHTTKN